MGGKDEYRGTHDPGALDPQNKVRLLCFAPEMGVGGVARKLDVGGQCLDEDAARPTVWRWAGEMLNHVPDGAEILASTVPADDLAPGRGLFAHHHSARAAFRRSEGERLTGRCVLRDGALFGAVGREAHQEHHPEG